MKVFDLSKYGLTVPNIFRNASAAKLYEEAIRYEPGTTLSSAGALIAYSGAKTGRSPKDKRVVKIQALRMTSGGGQSMFRWKNCLSELT
jgi:phosphoenolpyruvate carboxykinase (ATP)